MNINELTIGQAKELAALFGGGSQEKKVIDHGFVIVVLDRGFVYVGHTRTDGEWVYMTDAQNIRYWGTTKGLGELVHGPTGNTRLDEVGTLRAPFHALQQLIAVEESKWKSAF